MRPDEGQSSDLYGWETEDDRADDWLADQGELDWVSDPRRGEPAAGGTSASPVQGRRHPAPTWGGGGRGPSAATAETFARRRIVAALAAGGVVLVAVISVIVATSGGGSSRPAPAGVTTGGSRSTTQPATPQPTNSPTTGATAGRGAAMTPTTTQPRPAASAPEVTLPPSGTLKLGDSGAEVVALQKALAALGLEVGRPDGSFGPATKTAVAGFQTAHALTPDGIVGAATAKALNEELESRG